VAVNHAITNRFSLRSARLATLMEIPSSAARDQHDAIVKAEKIRKEVSLKIPSLDSLFGHRG
jgi:hypothetical protein